MKPDAFQSRTCRMTVNPGVRDSTPPRVTSHYTSRDSRASLTTVSRSIARV